MEQIKLSEEYIKLGQALKAAGLVSSGVEAKIVIDTRRGKKLYGGEVIEFDGQAVKIVK